MVVMAEVAEALAFARDGLAKLKALEEARVRNDAEAEAAILAEMEAELRARGRI